MARDKFYKHSLVVCNPFHLQESKSFTIIHSLTLQITGLLAEEVRVALQERSKGVLPKSLKTSWETKRDERL